MYDISDFYGLNMFLQYSSGTLNSVIVFREKVFVFFFYLPVEHTRGTFSHDRATSVKKIVSTEKTAQPKS